MTPKEFKDAFFKGFLFGAIVTFLALWLVGTFIYNADGAVLVDGNTVMQVDVYHGEDGIEIDNESLMEIQKGEEALLKLETDVINNYKEVKPEEKQSRGYGYFLAVISIVVIIAFFSQLKAYLRRANSCGNF
jgi:hypothetical protein